MGTVWLFHYPNGQPIAFSPDGEKTWFRSDGRPWAWAGSGGWLWSFDTHQALGWFSDRTFFSPDGQPIYFKGG